jgi:acetyltransferase
LILGSSVDPQFGPVLLFGLGGQLVEIFGDRALALPPLTSTLARRMMERTRIYKTFADVRGRAPIDCPALEQVLVRFSQLVAETPRIKEIDINPLLASPAGILGLDARVVLHDWSIPDRHLPRATIRPYPSTWIEKWTARDGSPITIRPIRPEDEPKMAQFHEHLSDRSVYLRYFHHLALSARVTHDRLTRICFINYDREMVLVAESAGGDIVAVGRLTRERDSAEAEFAVLVSDAWQEHGLGTELLHRLLALAHGEGIARVFGNILSENRLMQEVCRQLGFDLQYSPEEDVVVASLTLGG